MFDSGGLLSEAQARDIAHLGAKFGAAGAAALVSQTSKAIGAIAQRTEPPRASRLAALGRGCRTGSGASRTGLMTDGRWRCRLRRIRKHPAHELTS